jgi:putative transposase
MGTKKSVLVEQQLAVMIAGANVHDTKLLEQTIDAVVIARPEPEKIPQHLRLDKGYDNPTGEAACSAGVRAAHPPHRRGEARRLGEKTHPARRWVVERTIAWLQRCRVLLIRCDKKPTNYKGLIQLACALIWYRRRHHRLHAA